MQSNNLLSPFETNGVFLSVKQASRQFQLGERFLRNLIVNNEISYINVGKKKLILTDEIYNWYERSKSPVNQARSKGKSGG